MYISSHVNPMKHLLSPLIGEETKVQRGCITAESNPISEKWS